MRYIDGKDLDKSMEEFVRKLLRTLKREEPELFWKIVGAGDAGRDFVWEAITRSERPLLERVSEGEGVEDWEDRAKSGEVMRII